MLKASKSGRCQYLAFLRGINVGGNAVIKMADLKKAFEQMGFRNVRTLLASGNVIFEADHADRKVLAEEMEAALKKSFSKDISVMVRSMDDLKKLQSLEPFKGIKATPDTRLYVTFLPGKAKPRTITIPFATPQKEFRILHATSLEVFSVLDLSKGKGTTEAMNILEKEYGKGVTTRNWNTVLKALNG